MVEEALDCVLCLRKSYPFSQATMGNSFCLHNVMSYGYSCSSWSISHHRFQFATFLGLTMQKHKQFVVCLFSTPLLHISIESFCHRGCPKNGSPIGLLSGTFPPPFAIQLTKYRRSCFSNQSRDVLLHFLTKPARNRKPIDKMKDRGDRIGNAAPKLQETGLAEKPDENGDPSLKVNRNMVGGKERRKLPHWPHWAPSE